MYLVRHHEIRHERDDLEGELRKLKPHTFDGEDKKGEDVKAWLLGMRRYLQLHNCSSNMEARISIYNLHGKASICWDQLVQVKHIREKSISCRKFKKYF